MQKSGHSTDTPLILVPLAVLAVAGITLFGGPVEALEAINTIVGDLVGAAVAYVSALV
jgi:hypothetical protein